MDARELEITLEATLAVSRPTPRDLRDALVDYYVLVGRPFIEKGLQHTMPDADENTVRRLLLSRLANLWREMSSRWDDPVVDDLVTFRRRIEQYACVRQTDGLTRVHQLLDDLVLAATVSERLRALQKKPPVRKLKLIAGGGEVSEPRGKLRLVREAPQASSSSPTSSSSSPSSSSPPSAPASS